MKFLNNLDLNGNQLLSPVIHVSSQSTITNGPAGDTSGTEGQIFYNSHANGKALFFRDDSGWRPIGDISGVTAGAGLSGGGTGGTVSLAIDLSEFSDVTPANGDKILTLDSDGSTEQLTTIASLATLFAGSGLTATNSVIAVDTLNQDTTGTADHVTIVDNENTNEENQITFIEGAAGAGSRGLEADGDFTYNPSTGTVSATIFKGNIDAVDGDFDGTLEADAITIGGENLLTAGLITTLGTISQDTVLFTSANTDDPVIQIKNTNNSANSEARLHLIKDRGAAAEQGDNIGSIKFIGENDAQESIDYGEMFVEIGTSGGDVDTDEAGLMYLKVATSDGSTSGLRAGVTLEGSTSANTVNVGLGSGTASTVTVAGNLVVNGTTTTVNSTTVNLNDHNIVLDSGNSTSAVINGAGITIEGGSGDDATFTYSTTGPQFEMKLGSSYEDLQVAKLTASSLDISGNIDIDGTTNLDAVDIDGAVQLDSTLTIGANDQGYDVIFYGDTASANLTWDTSADDLILNGAARIVVPDGQLVLASTAVSSTAAELNLLDAGSSGSSVTLASGDSIIIGDASASNATKKVLMSDIANFTNSSIEGTGALNSGSITSGFGAIDNGTSGIRTNTFTAETSVVPASSDGASLGSTSAEWSDLYLADGAQILFGDDQEVRITHNADTGLTFSHEATGAAKPFVLTIESEEDAITNNDVIGGIQFKAGDSDGTDAILPAVGMFAVATDTFGTASNRAKLIFSVAASETAGLSSGAIDATVDMELDHSGKLTIGDDLVIKSSGTIGGANDTDLLTLGNGILTVAGEVSMTTLDIGGTNVTSTAGELNLVDGSSAGTIVNSKAVIYGSSGEVNATTLQIGGTSITSTAAEINLIDGGTARGTTAVADGDGFLHNDGGTMRMTNVSKLADLFAGTNISASSSVLSVADAADDTKGVVELATSAETITGTDTARAVTPDGLAARSVVATIAQSSLTDDNIVTITHNLGTADVIVQLFDMSTEATVFADVYRTAADLSTASTSVISIDFGTAPANDIRCLITSLAGATASGTIAYT